MYVRMNFVYEYTKGNRERNGPVPVKVNQTMVDEKAIRGMVWSILHGTSQFN